MNLTSPTQMDAAYMEAVEAGDEARQRELVEEAAKRAGYDIHAYHGTARGDRVGNVFLPERATSGPMAFFTSDRGIAENYARDKRDTSLSYSDEYTDYYTQFRVKGKNGKTMPVQDMWKSMTYAKRQAVTEAARHITWDEDMENPVTDMSTNKGLGNFDAYTLRVHNGNAIEALIDSWLESGELYNQESKFLEVLKLAGIEGVEYFDPDARHEKVYDVYLRMTSPFVTGSMYTNEFLDGLEAWWAKQDQSAYVRENAQADLWDKNGMPVEKWIDRARDDVKDGRTNAWTVIPDAVTDYLRSQGYDGIQDQGGKHGGDVHTVYIPFASEQVKSAEPVTRDDAGNVIPLSERFNMGNRDIRWLITEDMTEEERYQELKDAKIRVADVKNTEEDAKIINEYAVLGRAKGKAEAALKKLCKSRKLIEHTMRTPAVEGVEFTMSLNGGLNESMHRQLEYGGDYGDFTNALLHIDEILQNAILIEQHSDRYIGTYRADQNLESNYVLLGVAREVDTLIPVTFLIKKMATNDNRLYMMVVLSKKVPSDVVERTQSGNPDRSSLLSEGEYSLSEIVSIVKPEDKHFLKYIPSQMLTTEQNRAKQEAQEEDRKKLWKYRRESRLDQRVKGDDLQAAQDLIEEVRDNGGEVDENGYITLYHRTTEQNATRIRATGRMIAKEDGLFFSTKRDGQNEGYGDSVVTFKIPAEKLVLDDVFGDEAHLRYPLGRARSADMSEYVLQENTQIPEHPRFNATSPVEQVGDLVAVHNTEGTDLLWNVEHGGFAMPSNAIVKVQHGMPHYGPFSVIFSKWTIDPANPLNRAYGGDAFTPTIPYAMVEKRANQFYEKAKKLVAGMQKEYRDDIDDFFKNRPDDAEERDQIALANNALRVLYLKHKGVEWQPRTTESYKTGHYIAQARPVYEEILHNIEEDGELKRFADADLTDTENIYDWTAYLPSDEVPEKAIRAAWYYLHDNHGKNAEKVQYYSPMADHEALRKAITDKQDYLDWIHKEFGRWWTETYTWGLPDTLHGIVDAMKRAGDKGVGMSPDLYDSRSLIAKGTKEYKSLDAIRADKGRLGRIPVDKYSTMVQEIEDRATQLGLKMDEEGVLDNPQYVFTMLADAAYAYSQTEDPESIYNVYPGKRHKLTDFMKQEMLEIIEQVRNLPTEYFESKPERVVGLDEIQYVIAPDNASKRVLDALKKAGIEVRFYRAGDEADRLRVLNELPTTIRFSLGTESDGGDAVERDGALNIPIDVKIDAQEVQDYARAALANGRKVANQTVDALTNNKLDAAAGKILKAVQSKYGREALRMKMIQLAQEYAKNGPSDATMAETVKLAQDILEQSTKKDDSLAKEYADVKKRLRETPIVLTSTQMTEVAYHWGSVAEFKRQMRGSVKIVKNDGVSLDSLWLELSERAPEFFPTTTGEAEMPEALADFREAIKPRIDNIYGMDRDALAADLALRIQGDLMVVLGARAQAKNMYGSLQEMRTAWDEEMKKRVQEDNKKRVEEFSKLATDLRAAKERGDRGAYDSRMRKYRELVKREGMSRMISEATFNRRMLERNAEKTAKARERLTKKANSLLTRLRKPYKGEHIPTMLQQTVLDVLNALDFAGEGAPTVKEKDFAAKLEAITGFYDKVLAAQSRGETAQEAEGTLITVCQKQVDDLKRYLGGILESGKIRIDDMDFRGLGYINAAMDMINQTIDTINTLWRGDRYKKVSDLAEATMDDLDKMKEQTFSRGSLRGMAYDLLQRQMATPETYGQLLGEAGKSLIDSLFEGERIMEKRIQEASDHTREAMEKAGVTDAEIGEWQRHVQTLHFKGGTVKMTDSMVMSLYLTMLRPQGLQHILGNGIRIPSTKETGNQVKTIFMDGTDTGTVYAALTDKQRTVAGALQKYLASDVAKWGNDITQAMYLYDAFTEKSYWPLTSDPNVLKTQEPTADRNLGALMNPGFLKPLVEGANNPVIIQDAFQVYNKHISEMANYNGLAMPISNTLAMLNYVRKDEVEENVYRITGTVKQSMERALGKSGATYLTNLVQDLNAARHEQEKTPIDKLLGNYKKYAVVGKIRVMIQQPTSIVRAASEIDYRYLMAGMHAPKGTMEEMVQHSALAWWKQNGNYETGMGKSMMQMMFGDTSERVPGTKWGRDTVMEKVTTFGGAIDPGKADDFAWQRMWQAVKLETRDKHPELKQGSDAYWEHVTKRFEKIMDRTQVVDTVMHRSAIMRSTNAINKTVTSFMAEPIASYNMLMRDVVELYRNWNTPEKRDKLAKLCNDAIVYTAAAFVTAIATGLVDAMRNPSDDDKDLLERLKGDFWKDWIFYWLKNGIGEWRVWRNLPYLQEGMDILVGDEMPEALASWITGRDEFRISIKPGSYELPQMQGISNLVAQTKKVMDYIAGGNTKRSTFYGGIIRPMSTGLGELFGLPAGVLNTLETFDRFLGFNLTKTSVGYTSTTETYDALYQAIASGDKKKADRIRQELREGKYGMTEKTTKTIQTGIGKVLAKEDSRIAEAHELLQRGQYIAAQGIIEEIIGEGFDKDVVEYAVNYYKTIMASEAKDRYIAAIGAQDDEQASQIMEDAIAAGYVTRSAAEKWMPTTGEDETLEASTMSRETFVRAMESGTQADISAALQAAREAGTKDTTIAGWLNDRYKDEYIALWKSGRKAEANALGRRLQALGLMKELKSGTVNCYRDDYLKGWQKEAEKG